MRTSLPISRLLCLCALSAALSLPAGAGQNRAVQTGNEALVRQSFDDWLHRRGTVFDLLAENARWTVAGASPVSGSYLSRQALLDRAVRPINARLSTPIRPRVKQIVAQGNQVVILWDGSATGLDGGRYDNSYARHLVMEEEKIVEVTAFPDTWRPNELMK